MSSTIVFSRSRSSVNICFRSTAVIFPFRYPAFGSPVPPFFSAPRYAHPSSLTASSLSRSASGDETLQQVLEAEMERESARGGDAGDVPTRRIMAAQLLGDGFHLACLTNSKSSQIDRHDAVLSERQSVTGMSRVGSFRAHEFSSSTISRIVQKLDEE